MIYLTGATNDRDEPSLIAAGVGLMIQPGNGYLKRLGRYPYWAADNGCFNPETYIGDDKWLDWVANLPTEGCLFVVVPDVSRKPDGTLGGDPAATWEKFKELAPVVRSMGYPVALVAQNGMEDMPNVQEQLEACDVLFLGGDTAWKLGPDAEALVVKARALGKWVHMGRVNSFRRFHHGALIGCNSADGTYIKYRRRKLAGETVAPDERGAGELAEWKRLSDSMPGLFAFETPSLPIHKEAS